MIRVIIGTLRYKVRRVYYKYIKEPKKYKNIESRIEACKNVDYIVIHNPEWLGVSNSTRETFDNTLELIDMYSTKVFKNISKKIIEKGYKTVIFSGFVDNWINIAKTLKELDNNVKIKVIWHGGNALLVEQYDWQVFKLLLDSYNKGLIDQFVFVKKSMADFYKAKGYNTFYLLNNVKIDKSYQIKKDKNKKIRIGLYSSGNRWVKNVYNQLSAISLVNDSILDCVAYDDKMLSFVKRHKINMIGERKLLLREELFKRIANNDVNVYVTFSECAPMLPLESFELGVPCVTANNHTYFEGSELEDYTVVQKVDNIMDIYEKIDLCLKNRDKIMKLYKEWKKNYNILVEENIKEFLNQ